MRVALSPPDAFWRRRRLGRRLGRWRSPPRREHLWTSRGPADVAWVTDAAIADGTVYAGTLNGVFRSVDGASTWQAFGLQGLSIRQVIGRSGASAVYAARAATTARPPIFTRRGTAERRGRPSCPM